MSTASSRLRRVVVGLLSLLAICLAGAPIARIVLGANYEGIALIDDLRMNLGIVIFFVTASGFAVAYVAKFVLDKGRGLKAALTSALLFWLCALFLFGFIGREAVINSKILMLIASGSATVFVIDFLARHLAPRNAETKPLETMSAS